MRPSRTPWLLALPLMFGGTLAVRSIASVCLPHEETAGAEHAEGGLGTLEQWPVIAGVLAVLALLGLCRAIYHALRGRRARPVPAWVFLSLSPLAFLGQELAEVVARSEEVSLGPGLLLGLLVQVPFALVAYWAARALGRLAERVALSLGAAPHRAAQVSVVQQAIEHELERLSVLATGHPGRAPPWDLRGARSAC